MEKKQEQNEEIKIGDEIESKEEIRKMIDDYNKNKKKYQITLLIIFLIALLFLLIIFKTMPNFTPEEKKILTQFPNTSYKMQKFNKILKKYSDENFYYVLVLFCYFYLFMQSFAIPGPAFLSIISGSLWGFTKGLFITSLCATVGSTICYLISQTLIKGFILQVWSKKVLNFVKKVEENKNRLFFYVLFLRFTPLVPNILVNLASPIAGIPVHIFFISTLFGLMPLNCMHVETGTTLEDIAEVGMKPQHILILFGLSLISLIPTYFVKKKEKIKTK